MGEEGGRGSGMFEENTKNMVHDFKNVQAGALNDSLKRCYVGQEPHHCGLLAVPYQPKCHLSCIFCPQKVHFPETYPAGFQNKLAQKDSCTRSLNVIRSI